MGFTQVFYLFAVEFNLIHRRCLIPHRNKPKSKTSITIRQKTNMEPLPKGALQTFLYLPSKSCVNVCLHSFVQSSSLKWIAMMLFHVCKRQKGLKAGSKLGRFGSTQCLELFFQMQYTGFIRMNWKSAFIYKVASSQSRMWETDF